MDEMENIDDIKEERAYYRGFYDGVKEMAAIYANKIIDIQKLGGEVI